MGIKLFSSSSFDGPVSQPDYNPNPYNFTVLERQNFNGVCVLRVMYPDCKNYEATKILVFEKEYSYFDTVKCLDPHFSKNGPSPIARFEPTKRGWDMAVMFARMWRRDSAIDSVIS